MTWLECARSFEACGEPLHDRNGHSLAGAMRFAGAHGLDVGWLVQMLDSSPLARDVSRIKAEKLLAQDFRAQAAIGNVLHNNLLIAKAARAAGIGSPLLDVCHALYAESDALGLGGAGMVGPRHRRALERRRVNGFLLREPNPHSSSHRSPFRRRSSRRS
jgi:hypothetical protein